MTAAVTARRRGIFRGWWIVFTGTSGLILSGGVTGFVFSVLIPPMEADLGWSRATIVGVLTLGTFVAGLLATPAGVFIDTYGSRALMAGGAALGGVCFMLTSAVTEPWQFYLVLGVVEATTHPALYDVGPRATIANWFIRKRPAAFAVFSIGRSVSGIVLVPIAAWLMAVSSWRTVYFVVGLVQLVALTPLSWWVIRRRPEDVGDYPDGEPPAAGAATTSTPAAIEAADDHPWTRRQVLRTKTYWLLTAGFFLIAFPASGIYIHMASYLRDRGLDPAVAASGLTVYGVGALVGRVVWATAISRMGIKHTMTSFAFFYAATVALYTVADGAWGLYASILVLGLVIGGSQQISAQVWPDYYGRRIVGTVTGLATLMNMPAAAASPLLMALVFDAVHSYMPVLAVYAALSLIAGVFFVVAERPLAPVAGVERAVSG